MRVNNLKVPSSFAGGRREPSRAVEEGTVWRRMEPIQDLTEQVQNDQ